MAKSLEEHLYRSAKSKEEYMDISTLKKRLQAIAHGLEIHRSSDDSSSFSQNDEPLGISQLGSSLRNDNDDAASQSSNFSVAAAVRSSMGSSTATGMAGGNMNVQAGTPPQIGTMDGGNSQLDPISLQQANNMAGQRSGSPGSFMPSSGAQQHLRQQSDTWSALQNSGNTNMMMSQQSLALQQQQGNQYQMNAQNSGNAIGQQHNQGHLMRGDNDLPDSDVYAMNANASAGNQASYPNASGSFNQGSQNQSNDASWASFIPGNSMSNSSDFANISKFQDPSASQKKRVIIQQQQRLLLLRHASKCTAGNQCTTKFCDQMVTLWKHMKTCRNKNCKTSHCLSSRCVLNHYRICKSNNRTSTCEVCGPVMVKIKQQEREDGSSSSEDPLTRDQDPIPLQGQHGDNSDQSQLYQVQAQQTRLKAQLDSLKVLQRQQEQLLEQQKNLELQAQNISDPMSHQARQLQEQQMLLQQLQKRCQQQQLLVQDELQMQSNANVDEQGNEFHGQEAANQEIANATVEDRPNPREMQQVQKTRRGSGIGKRFGKSLGLPAARRISEMEENAAKKKRPSVTKAERSTKKPRQAFKSKGSDRSKSDGDEDSTTTRVLEEDYTSLLSRMTRAEIQKHLESLNKRIVLSSRTVTHKCRPIIQEIIEDQFGWVFRDAVDPVALGLPDYYDVIKNPMHLDLIRKKLENAIYSDMESFARDTRLVFENAILYNGESSEVGELAQIMLMRFDKLYNAVVHGTFVVIVYKSVYPFARPTLMHLLLAPDIESSHVNLESQGELCSLCGVQKRRFEPTVLYCQGKCGMQRIKRNAAYFTDRTKQNHWCDTCFEQLDPKECILLDDGTKVLKKELQELKNDALPEEGWVNCDECHSWVHQVSVFSHPLFVSVARTVPLNSSLPCA
jgi:Bromodomain/TAZ zinc finger